MDVKLHKMRGVVNKLYERIDYLIENCAKDPKETLCQINIY